MNKFTLKRSSILYLLTYLILIYPVFYVVPFINDSIGYKFANYFFLAILFFIVLQLLIIESMDITISILTTALILITIALIMFFQSYYSDYIKPIIFIIYISFLYSYMESSKYEKTVLILNKIPSIMYIMLFLSFIFLIDETRYTSLGRFTGFVGSPTTFTVFLDVIFIFFLFSHAAKQNKVIVFLIILFFSILSETRLNMLFLLIVPFLFFILNRVSLRYFRGLILILFIIGLNLIYPTYQYFTEKSSSNVFSQRYEDGRDASFGLRYKMYTSVMEEIENSTIQEIIFGKGAGHSRELIIQEFDSDLLPHNDFIRFFLDFGLIASVLYFIFLFRIAVKNNLSVMIAMLYFLAFYHNMIYSYYLVSLIILANYIYQPRQLLHFRRYEN